MTDITRLPSDILGGIVRVTLGGQTYELPVRSIRANREWRTTLDERTSALLGALPEAGDHRAEIYVMLAGHLDALVDMLLSYDTTGALPTRGEIEDIEPDASMDVLAAVREVWRASNPLVGAMLGAMATSSAPTSSSAPPTAIDPPPTSMTA